MSDIEWSETYVKKSEAEEIISDLQRELSWAKTQLAGAEALRPVWAQGYTSDSSAAQGTAAALAEIWNAIGAVNQTDAMQKLVLMNRLFSQFHSTADNGE